MGRRITFHQIIMDMSTNNYLKKYMSMSACVNAIILTPPYTCTYIDK